jgi:hypothetical protein
VCAWYRQEGSLNRDEGPAGGVCQGRWLCEKWRLAWNVENDMQFNVRCEVLLLKFFSQFAEERDNDVER